MNSYADIPSHEFQRYVIYSFASHVAVALVLIVRAALFPSEPLEIRNAIRVDIVDLPDKISAPSRPAAQETPKVVLKEKTKAPEPKLTLKPKDNEKKALDKIRQMEAIENIKKQMAGHAEAQPAPQTFKGNILNPGDSIEGLDRVQYDNYFSNLKQRVLEHWSLPQWLADANLRAQALVTIDANGFVTRREILRSSGNEVFDGRVVAAIDAASPLPVPPSRLQNILSLRGMVLNFPD